ncbi:MAG: polysaccharide deacetylase family protein [Acidobacteriota bacterium]|nr:polysaccharide deacetylase family protein [Acidobacteriota bacterium]
MTWSAKVFKQPAKWRIPGVPVFEYHGLVGAVDGQRPSRERKYWVHEKEFRKQLQLIRRLSLSPCSLDELSQPAPAANIEANRFTLTFDDGLASQFELAYTLLSEFQTSAYFFVNTATIGMPGFLNWGQMLEMQGGGMSFQSHSHEHVYLSWLSPAALDRQLRESKQVLEDRLGREVRFLSAPFGDLNLRVVDAARRAGFKKVCNSRSWPSVPGKAVINRVAVYRTTSEEDFARLAAGNPYLYSLRAAREAALYLPKRLVLRMRPSPPPAGSLNMVTGK